MLIGTPSCARSSDEVVDRFAAMMLGTLFTLAFFFAQPVSAGTTRTQQISLGAGWNAIYLEVQPSDPSVAAVFDPAKVDFVARYFTPRTEVRFVENPGEQAWNTPAWGVWYAPDRGEDFLNSLHAVDGGCAYLVRAREAFTLEVTGEVRFQRLRWKAGSFNLTGLPVETAGTMTFAQFFSGAAEKLGTRIYRLVNGAWQQVTNLSTATARPGEACWIYCEGSTDYQGPLEARFSGGDGIDFGFHSHLSVLDLTNRGNASFTVQAALESSNLPLYRAMRSGGSTEMRPHSFATAGQLGAVAAGATEQLRLEARREQMSASTGSAVLKLTTSQGLVLRIPVRASAP